MYLHWLGRDKLNEWVTRLQTTSLIPFSAALPVWKVCWFLNFKSEVSPVTNLTWALMEIPCHFISQIDGSLVQIHTKFHDHSMSFFPVLFIFVLKLDIDFTSSRRGIAMAFSKKMMGFPSDLISFSIKLPSKRHGKIPVSFFTGLES